MADGAGLATSPGPEPGWAESVEERERGVASVSAPVVVDGGSWRPCRCRDRSSGRPVSPVAGTRPRSWPPLGQWPPGLMRVRSDAVVDPAGAGRHANDLITEVQSDPIALRGPAGPAGPAAQQTRSITRQRSSYLTFCPWLWRQG